MTLKLFHMPGSCSGVTVNALEEIGADYEDKTVALMRGEQRQPAFLAVNPKGKVPVLLVDDFAMTESPVILSYLAHTNPAAKLLPRSQDPVAQSVGLSDLVWAAGTLHPMMHRYFRPDAYTDTAPEGVKATAASQLTAAAEQVGRRVGEGRWWYGADWSIVDVYVSWVFATANAFGFPLDAHPDIQEHRRRVRERPSSQRAMQRERDAAARDGLSPPPEG